MGREDYELARRELELALDGVHALPSNTGGEAVARLYEFTQLVLHHPIIAPQLDALVNSRPMVAPEVRTSWEVLYVEDLACSLQELAESIPKLNNLIMYSLSKTSDQSPYETFRHHIIWSDTQETFEQVFKRLIETEEIKNLSIDKVVQLDTALDKISSLLDYASQRISDISADHKTAGLYQGFASIVNEVRQLTNCLKIKIDTLKRSDKTLSGFARAHSLHPMYDRLKQFDNEAYRALRPATSLPLPNPNVNMIWSDVKFVSKQLLARLTRGSIAKHILDRLRSYLEHFAYDDIVAKIEDEEDRAAREGGKAQRETILQDEIDRFIFLEGMFPITHNEASRGILDTLVDLYTDADRQRQTPILIELKQEINMANPEQINEASVRTAVGDALVQAERYRKHVCTHTHWTDVRPVVIIVHNCEQRLDLDTDDIVTIYLGTGTPSHKYREHLRKPGERQQPSARRTALGVSGEQPARARRGAAAKRSAAGSERLKRDR